MAVVMSDHPRNAGFVGAAIRKYNLSRRHGSPQRVEIYSNLDIPESLAPETGTRALAHQSF
jgi:hypothetical protein